MTNSIKNGFSACMGVCDAGWYGGVLVLDGRDKEFVKVPKNLSYEQRAAYARRWSELTVNPRREIRLVVPSGQEVRTNCIASAQRLEGPVAPREPVETPTLAWIERCSGQWHLVVFENNDVRTILSRNSVLRNPQIATTARGLVFAFESDTGPATTRVELVNHRGTPLYQVPGREPVLCAAGDGLVLCCEQATPDEVSLRLDFFAETTESEVLVGNGSLATRYPLLATQASAEPTETLKLSEGDYLLNADIAWSDQEHTLFITAESSPRWGYSNQIGLHREIQTWQWRPGQDPEALGQLPVEQRAFGSIGKENITPIKPFVLIEDGRPVVGFKQHRYTGFRAFGWDLFWCRREKSEASLQTSSLAQDPGLPAVESGPPEIGAPDQIPACAGKSNARDERPPAGAASRSTGIIPAEWPLEIGGAPPSLGQNSDSLALATRTSHSRSAGGWTEPMRISPETTRSDASFGLVWQQDHYIGLFPSHENEGGNGSKQSEDNQVDLVIFDLDANLPRFEIPEDKRVDYRLPPACRNVAPEPPVLTDPYAGRQLIWGDLHIHSIYSKCVAAVDGSPRENIRFAREVLGCRVFAFAEHTPLTTGIESTWLYDQLESTAGKDNVVLYATEPGIRGTRHMNFYSRDRETFEKLERILLAQDKRYPDILRQMREDLPPDSVFVMRHVHGDAIPDEQIPQHFDPHFEVAMEAMQGRGDAMLGEFESSSKFPNSFLDAGCKVGLVGGTDHFREWAPNHFCLTGFWVKEVSQDGVWEAIRNRHTIAMSDSRVGLLTRCKGAPMGETVTLAADEPMRVSVQASCGHCIRRIALMRDGELLPWTEVGATSANLELVDEAVTPGQHWYVVTAEVDTGHGPDNTGTCHASPYFAWKM